MVMVTTMAMVVAMAGTVARGGEGSPAMRDQALEPLLLQVTRRQVAQQDRHLPVLHQLVGETGIAARDLLGDQREGPHLAPGIELDPAELLRHPERANADPVGSLEDLGRQPGIRIHVPLALPARADERGDHLVDEIAA